MKDTLETLRRITYAILALCGAAWVLVLSPRGAELEQAALAELDAVDRYVLSLGHPENPFVLDSTRVPFVDCPAQWARFQNAFWNSLRQDGRTLLVGSDTAWLRGIRRGPIHAPVNSSTVAEIREAIAANHGGSCIEPAGGALRALSSRVLERCPRCEDHRVTFLTKGSVFALRWTAREDRRVRLDTTAFVPADTASYAFDRQGLAGALWTDNPYVYSSILTTVHGSNTLEVLPALRRHSAVDTLPPAAARKWMVDAAHERSGKATFLGVQLNEPIARSSLPFLLMLLLAYLGAQVEHAVQLRNTRPTDQELESFPWVLTNRNRWIRGVATFLVLFLFPLVTTAKTYFALTYVTVDRTWDILSGLLIALFVVAVPACWAYSRLRALWRLLP